MIGLPSLSQLDRTSSIQGMRIWLAAAPADMRCGFDRLAELAKRVTDQDPLGGHLFLFRSRGGDRLKVMGYAGSKFLSETMIWRRAPADLKRCTSA